MEDEGIEANTYSGMHGHNVAPVNYIFQYSVQARLSVHTDWISCIYLPQWRERTHESYIQMNMMYQFGDEGLMKVTDKYDVSVCRGKAHESYIHVNMMHQFGEAELMKVVAAGVVWIRGRKTHESCGCCEGICAPATCTTL